MPKLHVYLFRAFFQDGKLDTSNPQILYRDIENMAVGIRCADHATPLYPQKLALTSRSLGRFKSLANSSHGVCLLHIDTRN
jgi:hypothetical protein